MSKEKRYGRDTQHPPTLSEEDKARIRAEEAYRAQVRAEQQGEAAAPATPDKPMRSFRLETGQEKRKQAQALAPILLALLAAGIWWFLFQPRGVTTTSKSVTYAVDATCPVNVTYTVNGIDTQQEQGVPGNWTKTVQASSLTNTLIAQLTCDGAVSVGITGERGPNKTAASAGAYAIAQVSYP